MKKNLVLISLFFITLIAGLSWRNQKNYFFPFEEEELFEEEEEENEMEMDNPQAFIKFHQGIRTRSGQTKPNYPNNHLWTELTKAQQNSLSNKSVINARTTVTTNNGVTAFTERGPGNIPGRTRALIVDPDDATNQTWYAGSASGGIWKTTNAGTTWQWLTPNIPNLSTNTLAMAASNHNTIYAGTGEGFGNVDGTDGQGLIKSTDRGVTWTQLANSLSLGDVNRIIVNPNDETNVIVASNSGIFKSTDGGNSWTKVYSGLVQDVIATPGNFSIQYAGENATGVLKSTDGGTTWNISGGMSPTGRVEVGVSPINVNRLVASTEGSLSGSGSDLYVSNDAGNTWSLVTMTLSSKTVDYLGSQGWYDNTVAFSPFDQNVVYVAGVNAMQVTLGSASTGSSAVYTLSENNTSSFLSLINFGGSQSGGVLEVGSSANQDVIQIKFGSGITQKAHRFLVPTGATTGVATTSYTYQDYIDVPFQVWDVTTNQQLMVSFRDQDRNGVFNLFEQNTSATDATQQSREYIYINNVPYNATTPSSSIAQNGGEVYNEMYYIWPVLASGASWNPSALPASNLQITYSSIGKYSSTVKTVTDAYDNYDKVNDANYVHPDNHCIYPFNINSTAQTFQLLMSNDGGIYKSGVSTSPGTTQGEWKKVGNGYNTSQFYGADKRPGAQEYLGGMQDNATAFTPAGTVSSASTYFTSAIGGDGFEVLWHNLDATKMIGSYYNNNFWRSLNGGSTWAPALSGLPTSGSGSNIQTVADDFPFLSKLASSKQAPDNIYTVGSQGVWRSTNFGGSWTLTAISSNWALTEFMDVEVSRANATIVWAGSGQTSSNNLYVSTDAGKTFNAVPNPSGYTLGTITHLATHPINPNVAYALYSFAKTAKILMTTDLGQTWTDISGFGTNGTTSSNGFPDVAVYSLYVRSDNSNIIWAGTEIGIVESLDGGATWNLLTDFPSVGVWDMKGQDNEIVIATHGRGIWTATVPVDQNANFAPTQVLASGTSPQGTFNLKLNVPVQYDSIQIQIGSKTVTFNPTDIGTYILQLGNLSYGTQSIQLISYKNGAPVYSPIASGVYLQLQPSQKSFYDYFTSVSNFYLNNFSLSSWGNSNSSLQSLHNYAVGKTATATLLVPIIVSDNGNTSFIYDDVAIVQPGATGSSFGQAAFNDYVVATATTNGLDWYPIANGYNSSLYSNWLSTYKTSQAGATSLSHTETFDLISNGNFKAGDTILVSFNLVSNSDNTTGWGWSIDNLYIQQTPTAVQPQYENQVYVYPNPSDGKFNVSYTLSNDADVALEVVDIAGRSIINQDYGVQTVGQQQIELNLDSSPSGVYLIRFKSNGIVKTIKAIKK